MVFLENISVKIFHVEQQNCEQIDNADIADTRVACYFST